MTESPDEREGLPSASSWRRLELCPGSFQLSAEARQLKQEAHVRSVDASRGTLIHTWLAGQPDENGDQIKLSESEQTTADFLQERAQEQVSRIFGDSHDWLQLNEKRLWLVLGGQKALSGRFDRVLYTPTLALIQDWKTGWAEPDPAEQNAQLKVLAVLVALNLPSTVREVVVQLISGPYGVTEARYNQAALAEAYNSIVATLRAIHALAAPLNPSPEACGYCPAINICQKVKDLILPVATKTQCSELPDGARGARLLDECTVIAEHLKSIREYYAKRLTEDPTYRIPGWGMVPGVLVRNVTNWAAARARLAEYIDVDDLDGAANYRLGDLEKALGKKLKLKGPALKERMNTILQGLVEEKPNAASLKRVSGKPQLVEVTLP